jgi:hypothetical protein
MLTELQGDILPYFYGMVRTNHVYQRYRSRGILIEYLTDFRRLDHIAGERGTIGEVSFRPPTSSSEEIPPPSFASPESNPCTPPSSSTGPSTTITSAETTFADRISLSVVKENSRKGLAKIHRAGVCHGDVCGHNILVDILGNVVYIDFGFSRQYSKEYEKRDLERWREMWTEIEEIERLSDPEEL